MFHILRCLKLIPSLQSVYFFFWSYNTAFYSHAAKLIFSENLRGSEYSFLHHEPAGLRAPRPKEAKSNAFQAAVSHSRRYPTRSTLARGQWRFMSRDGRIMFHGVPTNPRGGKKKKTNGSRRRDRRAAPSMRYPRANETRQPAQRHVRSYGVVRREHSHAGYAGCGTMTAERTLRGKK